MSDAILLIEELGKLARRDHFWVDGDNWYSCPLAPEGCADETKPKECDCGADAHNAKALALLLQLRGSEPANAPFTKPMEDDGATGAGMTKQFDVNYTRRGVFSHKCSETWGWQEGIHCPMCKAPYVWRATVGDIDQGEQWMCGDCGCTWCCHDISKGTDEQDVQRLARLRVPK